MSTLAHVVIDPDTAFTPMADTVAFIATGKPIRAEVRSPYLHLSGAPADMRGLCAAIAEACDKADAAVSRQATVTG